MQIVESGSTQDNMAWCGCHTFVVNSDDRGGLHSFVCAFDCHVPLERFVIWVSEPLSSIHSIHLFLLALKKLCLTTKHRALGFQVDVWSCRFQSTGGGGAGPGPCMRHPPAPPPPPGFER